METCAFCMIKKYIQILVCWFICNTVAQYPNKFNQNYRESYLSGFPNAIYLEDFNQLHSFNITYTRSIIWNMIQPQKICLDFKNRLSLSSWMELREGFQGFKFRFFKIYKSLMMLRKGTWALLWGVELV